MIYHGNHFQLDTDQYTLTLNDREQPVEPRIFDLLVHLVEHRDRVVTRDELLNTLWKGRVVTDSALNAAVKAARKAVGDNGRDQSVIQTIHGRGYRFIARVDSGSGSIPATPDPGAELHPGDTDSPVPIEQRLLADSGRPVVAVLTFQQQDPDGGDFASGLTEDIIDLLSRFRELVVISNESSALCNLETFEPARIGRELGAGYLVTGQVRREADDIRISVRLLESASGRVIYSDRHNRPATDLFSLQEEVAARIATSLAEGIQNESDILANRKRPDDQSVHDLVVRARTGANSYDPVQIMVARELLHRALELDPQYAATHIYLSWSYLVDYELPDCRDPADTVRAAHDHAIKAVNLDPFDSRAHYCLAWVSMYQRLYDLAETHFNRALDLNPNDSDALCIKGWLLVYCGRTSEAERCSTMAMKLNPLAPDWCLESMATAAYVEGDYSGALDLMNRLREPQSSSGAFRAACHAMLDQDADAGHWARKAEEQVGEAVHDPAYWERVYPFSHPENFDSLMAGLARAGLVEGTPVAPVGLETTPSRDARSIAVLMFDNLSGDPGQRYFAEGITLNITSSLARIRSLTVKSGASADPGALPLTQVAADMEVRYLLTGGVQREGERVRVTVKLIDGESGKTRWSERYDRRGSSVIDIQDDIAGEIVATLCGLHGQIHEIELEHLKRKPTRNFTAFDHILKGIEAKERYTREGVEDARRHFARAIELEPDSPEAHGWSGWARWLEVYLGIAEEPEATLEQAFADANRAIALDHNSEFGYWTQAACHSMRGDREREFEAFEQALSINPNNPDIMVHMGEELAAYGQHEEGIALIRKGMRFHRNFPEWYWWHLGLACFYATRHEEGIDAFNRMTEPNIDTRIHLSAMHALTGDIREAASQYREILALEPDFEPGRVANTHGMCDEDNLARLKTGLETACSALRDRPRVTGIKGNRQAASSR